MSILMEEIAHINHHLFEDNRKLKAEIEQKNKNEAYDQQLFLQLSRKYKEALEKIARLEAELSELRMREESKIPRTSELNGISGALPGMHDRQPLRGPCSGD